MSRFDNWTPKLVLALRSYTARDFVSDVIAGLTVGLVALPLAMAFGIASGVTPQAGSYTAVVAGVSDLGAGRFAHADRRPDRSVRRDRGGHRREIRHVRPAALVTLMAGVMLVVMGLTRLGTAVKFIPRP